jgi:hypothetical protein
VAYFRIHLYLMIAETSSPAAPSRMTRAMVALGYALWLCHIVIAFLVRNCQGSFDEGVNLDLASGVLQGYRLYGDLFHHHLPAAVYLGAWFTFFTGPSLPMLRLLMLFITAGMFLWLMRISRMEFAVGFAAVMWALVGPYYLSNQLLYDNIAMLGAMVVGVLTFAIHARGLKTSSGMFVGLSGAAVVMSLSNPFIGVSALVAICSLFFARQIPWLFVVKLVLVCCFRNT